MGALEKCGVGGYVLGLTVVCYRWISWADERRQTYPSYPELSNLYVAGLWCILFTFLHWGVRYALRPVAKALVVRKPKWSTTVYEAKLTRFASAVFKAMFFTGLSAYSYVYVLRDSSWCPPALFGSGSTKNAWGVGNAGDTQAKPEDAFTMYYVVCIGYHLSEMLFQVLFELEKPDFVEMMLHHSTTCFLVFSSYSMNFMRIGSLVLILHDVSDIPVYMAKIFVDTSYKITTFVSLLGMLSTWGYFRLYVLPRHVITSILWETAEEIKVQGDIVSYGFSGALTLLLCLHVFWYSKFLMMGWGFLTKNETNDTQANISAMDVTKSGSKRD